MRTKAMLTIVILLLGANIVLGQRQKLIKIDSEGDFHLGTRTMVGDHMLEKGMYRVTISHINSRNMIAFYKVPMNGFGKGMWPGARRELFRIEVVSEPGIATNRTILRVLKKESVQFGIDLTFKGDPARYVLPVANSAGL